MNSSPPVQLIAVAGGSGAGKGWLVERLCRLLGERACHLQLDDFYRDRSHLSPRQRTRLNFDLPGAIDWVGAERVLRDCRAGRPTAVPSYDFATHCRIGERSAWTARPIVIVEGLWLLRPPGIRALFDLKIFLDTPANLRCTRRLARDVAERGYTPEAVDHQLRTAVVPMHERYVEPQKKWADLVLTQPFQEADVAALTGRIWAMLASAWLVQPWEHETFRSELFDLLLNHQHEYCH
jgi:uridine kinase